MFDVLLMRFVAPPSPVLAATAEEHEEARLRALETLASLAALFGEPSVPPAQQDVKPAAAETDSVAAWSATEIDTPKKEMLADPMTCPPYCDPSSVLIADQASLEYELGPDLMTEKPADDGNNRVRFRNSVYVVDIPHFIDMSPEEVESVWTSTEAINDNRLRNAMEYNWDGRDWANVLEEHQMIYDPVSGEYIHPATWEDMEIEKDMEREQELMRQAREEAERRERHRVEANKKNRTRRRRKTEGQRHPPRTSPKSLPRNMRGRNVAPPMAASGSLTRFADT